MKGADGPTYVRTYVRTVDDFMAIKPNFLASMGYQYFLSYGAPRARSSATMQRNQAVILRPMQETYLSDMLFKAYLISKFLAWA